MSFGISVSDAHVLITEYPECLDTFVREWSELKKIENKKDMVNDLRLSDIIFNVLRPFYEKDGSRKLQTWQHKKRLKIMYDE